MKSVFFIIDTRICTGSLEIIAKLKDKLSGIGPAYETAKDLRSFEMKAA